MPVRRVPVRHSRSPVAPAQAGVPTEEGKRMNRQDVAGMASLARLRQMVYRLFSTLYLYPDAERLATLAQAAGNLQQETEFVAVFPFFLSWRRLLTTLHGLTADEIALVEKDYVRLFHVNLNGMQCLPYESFYLDPKRQAMGWNIAQLECEYAASGLRLSPSLKELPDHAAVELEFMAFLCDREAETWEKEAWQAGFRVLERQRSFLHRHLGRWFPVFARKVAIAVSGQLYGVTSKAADAFIHHDRDLVTLLLERFRAAEGLPVADRHSTVNT